MRDLSADLVAKLRRLSADDIYDTREVGHRAASHESAQDDYAARRVPATWRWSAWESLWAFSGISTALVFMLMGGLLVTFYGGKAVITAALLTFACAALGAYHMARKAANEGAVVELLSKHTFGFKGSAYQIVIYGILGVIYFSLEGHVMSAALSEVVPGLPYAASAAIVCLAFIPLSLYGMQFLTRFEAVTVWIYVLGVLLVGYAVSAGWSQEINGALAGAHWWNINPGQVPYTWEAVLGAFGPIAGVLGAILVLLCTDMARFARRSEARKAGLLISLLGVSVPLVLAMTGGVYLVASSAGKIADPGIALPRLLGVGGLLLVVLTQVRINVVNVYFGTTALENFAVQVFQKKWTRQKLLLPFMALAYGLLISPLLQYFSTIMTMLSVFLVDWAAVLLGELWLVRRLYGIPQWSEFRRGYVASFNRVGMLAMWLPTPVGVALASGRFGPQAQALAVPLAGVAAFMLPALLCGLMSKQRVLAQYFARVPVSVAGLEEVHSCLLCAETFHRSDFVLCPFHNGRFICSRCCATEGGCGLVCHGETKAR
jgi:purine-cytosine permease-like protein